MPYISAVGYFSLESALQLERLKPYNRSSAERAFLAAVQRPLFRRVL